MQVVLATAQYSFINYKYKEYQAFKNCKVVKVILTGNATVDDQIKQAVTINFTSKPVEYIKAELIESAIKDKESAFMGYFVQNIIGEAQPTHYFGLILGGEKSIKDYNMYSCIAYAPIDYYLTEPSVGDVSFRLPIILVSIEKTVQLIEQNKMNDNNEGSGDFNKLYSKNAARLKQKTLLVNSACGITAQEIKEVYKYNIEVCGKEKIAEVIKSKNGDYAVFQQTFTRGTTICIYDCKNFDCIYAASIVRMKTNLKKNDFKDIMKQIN